MLWSPPRHTIHGVRLNPRCGVSPLVALAIAAGVAATGCARSSPVSPSPATVASSGSSAARSSSSGPPAVPFSLLPDPTDDRSGGRTSVVIISIDGLRPDAIPLAPASNLLALARRGAYSWRAQTVLPSTTLPSHVSMLTGFPPEVHGVTWDDYTPTRRIKVPTLFGAVRAAGRRTALLAGKEKFTYFRDAGCCDLWELRTGGDEDLSQEAVLAAAGGVDLLAVHLPQVDLTGHATSWMSERYLSAVRQADAAVGRIVSALPSHATVIVTADHGGHMAGHGTADPLDTTIPWILVGPTVARGRVLASPIRTMDTAATAAYVLGVMLPAGVDGRPVLEAFESER